MKKIFEVLLY